MTDRIYTAQEKLEAIEREISYRRVVYVRRVATRKMSKASANYQISLFEAMRDDYKALAEKERLI